MDAQKLQLDYFQFYDVANQQAGYVVGLQGQFDENPEKAQLNYLNLFANPVSKNGEKMFDRNAHLTWYDLFDPVPDPMRQVEVEDQFGRQRIVTGRVYALLVPTQKAEKGSSFPDKLDHYLVYQVLDAQAVNKEVKLQDQFGATKTRVYAPIFFAVPARKWWEGQTFGIHNDKAHLLIYRIYPASVDKTILTRDQFGRRYQQVFRSVLLAAPCVKQGWKKI